MKLKRKLVQTKYAQQIEAMYRGLNRPLLSVLSHPQGEHP